MGLPSSSPRAAVTMLLLGLRGALSAPAADKITSLPGLAGEPSTPHYSGYLDIESGGQGKIHLHYWLTTSQSTTPEKDPVVLVSLATLPERCQYKGCSGGTEACCFACSG